MQRANSEKMMVATYKWKKRAFDTIKIYKKQSRNGVNQPEIASNEYKHIINFLSKLLFKNTFDAEKRRWIYIWGETKLLASKVEENMANFETRDVLLVHPLIVYYACLRQIWI